MESAEVSCPDSNPSYGNFPGGIWSDARDFTDGWGYWYALKPLSAPTRISCVGCQPCEVAPGRALPPSGASGFMSAGGRALKTGAGLRHCIPWLAAALGLCACFFCLIVLSSFIRPGN